jgi:prepilin-type N-terminal cleavage/methylation domain-containing protein
LNFDIVRRPKTANTGFTLLELVIAIAVLLILTAFLAPQYFKYYNKALQTRDSSDANEVMQKVQLLALDEIISNKMYDSKGRVLSDLHYEAVTNIEGVTVPAANAQTDPKDRIRDIYNAINESPPGYEFAFICSIEYGEITMARYKNLQTSQVYSWSPNSDWSELEPASGGGKYWYEDVAARIPKVSKTDVYWNGQNPKNAAIQEQINRIKGIASY